jgi:hypothetical protein
LKEVKVTFARNIVVSRSGRGYVDVSVRHTDVAVHKSLPDDVKASLTANYGTMSAADADRAWREAMDVLEGEAVDEARRLWKLRRRTT